MSSARFARVGVRGARAPRPGRPPVRLVALLVLVAVLCGASVLLYVDGRNSGHHEYVAGERRATDRIMFSVTVQKVDPGSDEVILRVLAAPQGSLARPQDGTPRRTFEIRIGATADPPVLRFPARQPITTQTVTLSLANSGTFSDYPFDHYTGSLPFLAVASGNPLPMVVSLRDVDPFFVTRAPATLTTGHVVVFKVRISRSRGTFILAWFIMIAMWGMALAVLAGAWILISRRRGLVWPAFAWMATTLFALVSVRNAAPGSPPIGSLIDYAAFFWAEGIIAASLVAAVFAGFRAEVASGGEPPRP